MKKNEKKIIFRLDGVMTPCYIGPVAGQRHANKRKGNMAPNKRDSDKRALSVYIPCELYQAFKKRAAELNSTMTELLTLYIIKETKNIKLTRRDYEEIIGWREGH